MPRSNFLTSPNRHPTDGILPSFLKKVLHKKKSSLSEREHLFPILAQKPLLLYSFGAILSHKVQGGDSPDFHSQNSTPVFHPYYRSNLQYSSWSSASASQRYSVASTPPISSSYPTSNASTPLPLSTPLKRYSSTPCQKWVFAKSGSSRLPAVLNKHRMVFAGSALDLRRI